MSFRKMLRPAAERRRRDISSGFCPRSRTGGVSSEFFGLQDMPRNLRYVGTTYTIEPDYGSV